MVRAHNRVAPEDMDDTTFYNRLAEAVWIEKYRADLLADGLAERIAKLLG